MYPLNQLKQINQILYLEHVLKYQKRKHLMNEVIIPLNCLWNDVLFFSPINLSIIKKALESYGYDVKRKSFFKIPADMLDPTNTTIYTRGETFSLQASDFSVYDPETLDRYGKIPQRQFDYFSTVRATSTRNPFSYAYCPHVLYKGTLCIKNIEIIEL